MNFKRFDDRRKKAIFRSLPKTMKAKLSDFDESQCTPANLEEWVGTVRRGIGKPMPLETRGKNRVACLRENHSGGCDMECEEPKDFVERHNKLLSGDIDNNFVEYMETIIKSISPQRHQLTRKKSNNSPGIVLTAPWRFRSQMLTELYDCVGFKDWLSMGDHEMKVFFYFCLKELSDVFPVQLTIEEVDELVAEWFSDDLTDAAIASYWRPEDDAMDVE